MNADLVGRGCLTRSRAIARSQTMSLKRALTDLSFKRDASGRTIVYLYGRTGYVVADAANEEKLRTIRFWPIVSPRCGHHWNAKSK
jgi:hypothetical protein